MILIGAGLFLSLLTGGPWQYLPPQIRHYFDFREGKATIESVEAVRRQTGAYPHEVNPPSERLSYRRVGDGYKLLLEEGSDEWYVFDSRSRRWTDNGDFGNK